MRELPIVPELLISLVGGAVLAAISYAIGMHFGFITSISWLEAAGVALNYSCVWLVSRQSMSSWPTGILASALLGLLFWQLNLLASFALQLVYFTPVQLFGWYVWLKGKDWYASLPVTTMSRSQYLYTLVAIPISYAAVVAINIHFGGLMAWGDCVILTLSIVAQILLTYKKIESWILWIIVDIFATYVYWVGGAQVASIQYGLFLLNALYGLYCWYVAYRNAADQQARANIPNNYNFN